MEPTFTDILRQSPQRPPDWRWQLAQASISRRSAAFDNELDAPTTLAADLLRTFADQMPKQAPNSPSAGDKKAQPWDWRTTPLPARLADVRAALTLHHTIDGLFTQALLLARWPLADVAARIGRPLTVVVISEQLFFNVLDRMADKAWIGTLAVWQNGDTPVQPSPASILRFIAYNHGQRWLEMATPMLIHGQTQTGSFSADEIEEVQRFVAELLAPMDSASEIEVALRHPLFGMP